MKKAKIQVVATSLRAYYRGDNWIVQGQRMPSGYIWGTARNINRVSPIEWHLRKRENGEMFVDWSNARIPKYIRKVTQEMIGMLRSTKMKTEEHSE